LALALALLLVPLLGLATPGTALAASGDCTTSGVTVTCTFDFTGAAQTWTVPAGVTEATFDLYGAQGREGIRIIRNVFPDASDGGKGGRVRATLVVVPGTTYQVLIGGVHFNGGGGSGDGAGNGGGASDVRSGTFGLADRLLVAGGGGGGGVVFSINGRAYGGAGGYPNGGDAYGDRAYSGGGGTQSGGGAGGLNANNTPGGSPGSLGQGGSGGRHITGGAGGGGGYYGGGGGGGGDSDGSRGGGGGSSYGPAGATFENGVRSGNGQVIITFTDTTSPVASPTQAPAATSAGWNTDDVAVSWNWADEAGGAGIDTASCTSSSTSSGEGEQSLSASCADLASNQGNASYTVKVDKTAPTISAAASSAPNAAGWYTGDVTVAFNCADALSGIPQGACPSSQTLTGEGTSISSSAQAVSDAAGNTSAPSNVVTVAIDRTVPTVSAAATSSPNAAGWYNAPVTVQFSCADVFSGVASCPVDQTLGSEGSAVSSTAQTASDVAGNTSAPSNIVSANIDTTAPTLAPTISPSPVWLGSTATASPNATDTLSGIASESCGALDTSSVGVKSVSCTATDQAGNSASASVSYQVLPTFPATSVLDTFNRANGGVGSKWDGLTATSFYKISSNQLDVQLGGPLVWKPTSFGSSQEAFVTLSTIDTRSPSQGLLLKVQSGSIPDAGAISVVYDAVAKVVRVSALRLGRNGAWTLYPATAATFRNGDVLGARALANGEVKVYKNGALLASVTLNAADQAFFNAKGGKIGIWTAAASKAVLEDFGGGTAAP
jgi:hypothetical protein